MVDDVSRCRFLFTRPPCDTVRRFRDGYVFLHTFCFYILCLLTKLETLSSPPKYLSLNCAGRALLRLAATLLSFICILPLGIYSIDNGALSNTWLSPYVGPLLEFLLALALFISILFLNINPTTAPSIFRRQYDRTRAPTHMFNLTVTAAGRGPAILLVVQFFALITYAFTLGVTSATSHNGTRSDLRVAISLRTAGLHTVYDVLLAFWITSWVVLLYCASPFSLHLI